MRDSTTAIGIVRRYRGPATILLLGLLIPVLAVIWPAGLGRWLLTFGASVYAFGTIWWCVRAASREGPYWPHLLLVWAPVLPLALYFATLFRPPVNDNGMAMTVLLLMWPGLALLGAGFLGWVGVVLRICATPTAAKG